MENFSLEPFGLFWIAGPIHFDAKKKPYQNLVTN